MGRIRAHDGAHQGRIMVRTKNGELFGAPWCAVRRARGMNLASMTILTYVSFRLPRDWSKNAPGVAHSRAGPFLQAEKPFEPIRSRAAGTAPELTQVIVNP